MVVYAQGPGADEEAGRRYLGGEQWEAHPPAPLIGKTGRVLGNTFLPLAGLTREDCSIANTFRCRWNHTNKVPPLSRKEVRQAVEHCTKAHWRPPPGVRLYVAMGEYAYYALTGLLHDFSGWRGYLLPQVHAWEPRVPQTAIWRPQMAPGSKIPVLVTYHLASLWETPEAAFPTKRDWNKVASILAGTWPEAYPGHSTVAPDPWPTYAAFDSEFHEDDHTRLTRYSLATRDRQVWVVEAHQIYERAATLPGTTLIMHNAPADVSHAKRILDYNVVTLEDTMYAHAVLWTGKVGTDEDKGKAGGAMAHTLNYLGSIYGRMNRWKHLRVVAPKTYSGADALGTLDCWTTGLHGGLLGELSRDPQSLWVYENLQKPLVPIIVKMQERTIAVDVAAAKRALGSIEEQQQQEILRAQAYAGWPINLRSPKHLAQWLYDIEGMKVRQRYG